MATSKLNIGSILDVVLVASLAIFIAVLINASSPVDPITSVLLLVLTLAVTAVGVWRESNKEQSLDEVQLASTSFGARWGISAVIFVTLLATFFAPLQGMIEFAGSSFEAAEGGPFSVPVRLFILGLVCAMVIELLAKLVAAAIWRRSKR